MAIFGSLNDMTLADLLPLLKAQEGALEVFHLEHHPHVTLYCSGGLIKCVYVAGCPASPPKARSVVTLLMTARQGSFEFLPGARPTALSRLLTALKRRFLPEGS